jgi:D-glycero-alpha-D-manno-heptose-7-phosphate kinase
MIITKTPYRISFFGGGTDYPIWYKKFGGEVISTSINKYIYLSVRDLPPFFKHKYRIVYSLIESINDVSSIQHPAVREVLKYFEILKIF